MKKIYLFICVSLLCNYFSRAQNIATPLDSALLACFPFSGNANDVSGNNNNGIVNGAVLAADRLGNPNSAYSFNGSNQNIIIQNFSSQIVTNEQSISFWATANQYYTRSPFLMTPDDPSNRYNIHIYYGNQLSNSQTFWDFGNISSSGRLYTFPSPLPNSGQWDHWVFVTSAAGAGFQKCYKNGVLIFTKSGSSTFSNAQLKNLLIGGGVGTGASFLWFAGSIDDVKIYERVLIQNDVNQLFSNNIICCTSPSLTVSNATVCAGSNAVLTVSGAGTYSWSTGAVTNTISVTPLSTTVYSVTGNNGGCLGSSTSTVVVNQLPSLNIAASETLICKGDQVTLIVSGANTFTWQPGNLNGLSAIYSPTATQVFTVSGTDANNCTSTQTILIDVNICTGIISNGTEIVLFSVYPNPANDNVIVYYPSSSMSEIFFEISDVTGKIIKTKTHTFNKNSSRCDFNIDDFNEGIYFMKLSVKNGETKTIKLVKE